MQYYQCEQIEEIVSAFKQKEIIALPTDTVYGVSVVMEDPRDLDRLKHCKHRPETKPLPIVVSNLEQLKGIAKVSERTCRIADHFLPGALTLVLPVCESLDRVFTNGLETIAVRIVDMPYLNQVIDKIGKPLFLTSANQSGEKTALTYEDVLEQLPDIDGLVIGQCKALQASTILDCTKDELVVLRPGVITLEEIEMCLKQI